MTHPDQFRQRKQAKAAKVAAKKPDKTVVQLSTKSKSIIGSAIGSALGSVIGGIFAEDPDKFMTEALKLFSAKGLITPTNPVPKPGAVIWWEKKVPGVWYAVPDDGKEHAFAVAFDGDIGHSACGDVYLKAPLFLAATHGRCGSCERVLIVSGYKIDENGAHPPKPASSPPPSPKRAKKTKSA